mgnify:CR=1 FL=1
MVALLENQRDELGDVELEVVSAIHLVGTREAESCKTFGILGFGSIGSSVGNVAAALGMKVLYHSATRKKNLGRDFRYADLDTLFKRSDFLSLHCV